MKIAFSPCPNDTFIFYAWVHGLIPGAPPLEVVYADIDVTNSLAASGQGPEVMKISYAALPWVLKDYALLPCGGALGRGCGPLVLTADQVGDTDKPGPPAGRIKGRPAVNQTSHMDKPGMRLTGKRVAVPSERSTAYLLFRLWAAQEVPGGVGEIVVLPFQEIMPAVRTGKVEAGLVIHEARFTYPAYGLSLLADLGKWWENQTHLPIPLGAIIARRSLDQAAIANWIRASVRYAFDQPEETRDYVLSHAQEISPEVVEAHIGLYVNEFSLDLGEIGYAAAAKLLQWAAAEGLVPVLPADEKPGNGSFASFLKRA